MKLPVSLVIKTIPVLSHLTGLGGQRNRQTKGDTVFQREQSRCRCTMPSGRKDNGVHSNLFAVEKLHAVARQRCCCGPMDLELLAVFQELKKWTFFFQKSRWSHRPEEAVKCWFDLLRIGIHVVIRLRWSDLQPAGSESVRSRAGKAK